MSEQTAASNHQDEVKKLAELMKGIKFVMLTTMEPSGSLHSRPMVTQEVEFDGDLWFFTAAHSGKVWEAEEHRQVNVAFSNPEKNTYVSASGTAVLVRDRAKLEELWKPAYKIFFPKGLEDPELALLKVNVEQAEYWDSASTSIGRAFNFARAYLSKDPSKLGDHAKVNLQ
jgi:general stress protein 26